MNVLGSILKKSDRDAVFPLVHVRDAVVFPHTLIPFFAVTKSAVAAVDEAMKNDRQIFVSLLKGEAKDANDADVHPVGTLSRIIQQIKLPDGTVRLLIEGEKRGWIKKFSFKEEYVSVLVEFFEEKLDITSELSALMRACQKSFSQYAELLKKTPPETILAADKAETPEKLCDLIGNALAVKPEKKQEILSIRGSGERLEAVEVLLEAEIEVIGLQRKISQKVKGRIDRSQKEYFLQEQLKEINKELGKEGETDDVKELERAILAKNPPEEVAAKAKKELMRLSKLQALSPEAGVLRTYCEWIADLPWSEKTQDNRDISLAQKILDEDHFDMKKPKERILEFIAVRQLKEKMKGPILCFVGPPGTGKTSLGKSVARALGRKFVRISLGGVRDEAEIRGHRKTYVGALPGKILQSMKKAGTTNPVFLLDEIDKMSSDFRGDPASALLEVLDPEQNVNFVDHYLELPYDLSGVMFITTANSIHNIPFPLLDRMELIELPGYSEYEKASIAKEFIIPKELEANGLSEARVSLRRDAVLDIIRYRTMESGVRNLAREIARAMRKIARKAVEGGFAASAEKIRDFSYTVTASKLESLLGKKRYLDDIYKLDTRPGLAYGLAWTEAGGTILPVEASIFHGKGDLILTGNLGEVMKESARAALTFVRSGSEDFGINPKKFQESDIHIHVPEGAIPKDGPSAGIALTSVILSVFSGLPIKQGFAMTGEITLTGRILAIGGVKEKVLAAHRNKIKSVLLPEANRRDIDEIPKEVFTTIEFCFAETIREGIAFLFPEGSFEKAKSPVKSSKQAK